ncbi:unnamed protein product [Chilo suppressalis]|uniref:C2H2-type domain-containing protein n=1 Tax=Chilo suppressalis TaxID=168631 RepID=A0ABN8L103_CHISP|nr:unnamed protein product [Chilo suppressalis]
MDVQRGEFNCSDEDSEMNFAAFSTMGATGTHFVTTTGQIPVAKLQQNVSNNGSTLSQVVGMVGGVGLGDGVQYVRTLEGGLQATPQLISVPIALPGAKSGDPPQTVQIQVLNPNITLQHQQQPKYHMQIPIQGFQQGGAVLTVAYSPEANEAGGIQLVGQNGLPEGLQVVAALPPDVQLIQASENKEPMPQHQVFITPNQQIIINGPDEQKVSNNNNTTSADNNNGSFSIVIKEECDDAVQEDESSQGTEASDSSTWQMSSSSQQDLIKYLNTLPPQQTQQLPVSLQQFLRLNPGDVKVEHIEHMDTDAQDDDGEKKDEHITEAVLDEDGSIVITQSKKKKKYKKKPPRPARPKPGQVVIATASDGTTVFCCPECQMAYPEKEQLEMHLIVHKIERRFICGICGAGLKRKEHLERHKLGHNPERPYVCGVCRKGFKRREHLNLHTVIHSGVKTEMCGECGKGFYRKDHLRKHTRSHESKRARDEANGDFVVKPAASAAATSTNTILPEITIHVPTSSNTQVPVQINIPHHVVSSIAAAELARQQQEDTQSQLDALLAQHT